MTAKQIARLEAGRKPGISRSPSPTIATGRKPGAGRPFSCFTHKMREEFLGHVRSGCPIELARKLCKISHPLWSYWESRREVNPTIDEFFLQVEQAEAIDHKWHVENIRQKAEGKAGWGAWVASMTWLERRYPKEFSRPEGRFSGKLDLEEVSAKDSLIVQAEAIIREATMLPAPEVIDVEVVPQEPLTEEPS
ncbi:hypothetical protein ACYOEI_00095 [Singulisphaera rosea]